MSNLMLNEWFAITGARGIELERSHKQLPRAMNAIERLRAENRALRESLFSVLAAVEQNCNREASEAIHRKDYGSAYVAKIIKIRVMKSRSF